MPIETTTAAKILAGRILKRIIGLISCAEDRASDPAYSLLEISVKAEKRNCCGLVPCSGRPQPLSMPQGLKQRNSGRTGRTHRAWQAGRLELGLPSAVRQGGGRA